MLTTDQERTIKQVINVFETGTVQGNYGAVTILPDGPEAICQVTYGRSQTTEYGNLYSLLQQYVNAKGLHSEALRPFLPLIGHGALADDKHFHEILQVAGEDPVMQQVQDVFFDTQYFNPAMLWASNREFTLALSCLVIYDSFIHSGCVPSFLRIKFKEVVPKMGGDEKSWIIEYVAARDFWLRTHAREILRKTVYRTEFFKKQIDAGNWDLILPMKVLGQEIGP